MKIEAKENLYKFYNNQNPITWKDVEEYPGNGDLADFNALYHDIGYCIAKGTNFIKVEKSDDLEKDEIDNFYIQGEDPTDGTFNFSQATIDKHFNIIEA